MNNFTSTVAALEYAIKRKREHAARREQICEFETGKTWWHVSEIITIVFADISANVTPVTDGEVA